VVEAAAGGVLTSSEDNIWRFRSSRNPRNPPGFPPSVPVSREDNNLPSIRKTGPYQLNGVPKFHSGDRIENLRV
jgi:hypothetical protein